MMERHTVDKFQEDQVGSVNHNHSTNGHSPLAHRDNTSSPEAIKKKKKKKTIKTNATSNRHKSSEDQDREIERLTSIIIEAGISNDKYDDDTIRMMFADLEGAIQHLVTKYFNADDLGSQKVWPEYKRLRQLEDRDLWLQAHVATEIARSIISDQAKPCFGLPQGYEEGLCRLERFLDEMDVDPDELLKWRQHSLRVSELAMKHSKANGTKRRVSAACALREELERVACSCLDAKVTGKAMEAVDDLLDNATDIALALRSCSAAYCWQQLVVPTKVDGQATERIRGFGTGLSDNGGGPVEILFGPVYKQVDGQDVLLREGKVLWE